MSKKPVSMSMARPSKAAPQEQASATAATSATSSTSSEKAASEKATPPARVQRGAKIPARPTAAAARLEEGTKRIVVDVAPAVHKQVKVKAVEHSGGIKEYVLRLLEADGIDLSEQPDFVARPTGGKTRRGG